MIAWVNASMMKVSLISIQLDVETMDRVPFGRFGSFLLLLLLFLFKSQVAD